MEPQTPNQSNQQAITPGEILIVAVVLLAVIAVWTLFSALHPAITGGDLNLVSIMVSKDLRPGLYPRDDIFAADTLFRFYTPVYRWLVARVWELSGGFESGLVYLTPVALLVYLPGMFILARRVTHNTWLALGITVASANYYESMGEELWGVGGSHYLMSRTVFTAVFPYVFWLLLSLLERPGWLKAAGLGLAVGLAANLHPVSGWQLAILVAVLAGCVLGLEKISRRNWLLLGLMSATIVLGALPIARSVFGNTGRGLTEQVSFADFRQVIYEKYTIPFRPEAIEWRLFGLEVDQTILEPLVWLYLGLVLAALLFYFWGRHRWPGLVRWGWLIGGLAILAYAYLVALFNLPVFFIIAAGYVIYRFRLRQISALDWWLLSWLGLTILTSFVGYYLLMRAWETFELESFIAIFTSQIRASRFIYPVLYLLVALAGLSWAKSGSAWLMRLWQQTGWPGRAPTQATLAAVIGLVIMLGPGLSALYFGFWLWALLAVIGVIVAVPVIAYLWENGPALWPTPVLTVSGLVLLLLVLFGPLAPLVGPYLPLPTLNLLDPAARTPEPLWAEEDEQLYEWVRHNTTPDALIYWCDFGPTTTLQFRREAERSINLNWKDMNLAVYDMASLLSAHRRYRQLEAACRDFESVVSMAYSIEADYVLIPASRAVGLEDASCFINDRYALFPIRSEECIQNTVSHR